MPAYVAALSCLQEDKPVPFETTHITAENDEEAVRQAVEWRVTTVTTINRRTWLEVFREGESRAFHSKEIGRL
jgi:hypothetical protein